MSQQLNLIRDKANKDGILTNEELARLGQGWIDLDRVKLARDESFEKDAGKFLLGTLAFSVGMIVFAVTLQPMESKPSRNRKKTT